jgi:hypothetical protein
MVRLAALFVGMAALITISTIVEAADGCGQCMPQDEAGYEYLRDYGPPWYTGRNCDWISTAEMRRDTPRRIRPLRHGTIARRITRFRTDCVSHIQDVRPILVSADEANAVNAASHDARAVSRRIVLEGA